MYFQSLRAADVLAAAHRLRGVVRRTPLVRSAPLSRLAGGDVLLKLECEQTTGSFKLRGAYNALASLPEDVRERGVVASSAGNHGLGVAYAARALGITATVFVPRTAPEVKRQGIASLGARLDTSQPTYDAAHAAAKAFAAAHGATFVDPCLGHALLAGQGTVAVEVFEELPSLASLVVAVSGGGLVGGIASLVRRIAPEVRILGVQGERTAALARSLEAGRVVAVPDEPTLADGLAGGVDEYALDIGRHALDQLVTVSEEAIADAIAWLVREHGTTAEGSGAVGVAAVRGRKLGVLPTPAVVIVSGGNIDEERLDEILAARH